jgi:hypothetical protein
VNNELERIWKEADETRFEALLWHLRGMTGKTRGNPQSESYRMQSEEFPLESTCAALVRAAYSFNDNLTKCLPPYCVV